MTGIIQSGRFAATTFDPLSLSNCVLWLDASDTATIASSGGAVSQWNDKSGGANHFTQATAGYKPITNSRTENGRNAVDFDGTNDRMDGPTFGTAIDNLATYIVLRVDSGGVDYVCPIIMGNAGVAKGFAIAYVAQGGKHGVLNCGVAWHNGTLTAATSGVHILTTRRNAGTWAQHLDATTTGLSTSFTPGASPVGSLLGVGYTGGGYGYVNGLICEVLWYESAHDTTTRETVESYLRTKWGTP